MDEYAVDVFANRDEPVPLITVSQSDVEASSSEADSISRRSRLKRSPSPSRLKTKGQEVAAVQLEKSELSPASKGSLQDRLFSKILQQVVPSSEDVDDDLGGSPVDRRSSTYVSRPAFSLPLMTNNFRRFNARIGIVFVFQNRLIRLFTWRTPSHTLSFLATYTFVCLDPYLLIVVPLAVALFFIMVPAFTSRHPPPPPATIISSTTPYYHQNYAGPALAPARTIKPASETSKDFFRNMRDLQNCMADFSNMHDFLVSTIAPATNFSNETFSSQLFVYLTILTTLSFVSAHLLPWRLILLVAGWATTVSSHPTAQQWLARMQKRAERQASLALSDPTLKHQRFIRGIPLPATPAVMQATLHSLSAVTLSTTPETQEVEVFELQHRPLTSVSSSANASAAEWQPHLFTPTPYDPLSPSRIAGDRPRGTRFFEDVAPPEGWEWASKKWELDLEAGEWVNERLVVGVEYDVLHHANEDDDLDDNDEAIDTKSISGGTDPEIQPQHHSHRKSSSNQLQRRRESVNLDFGGWVWDLPPVPGSGLNRDDDLWLAYGDYELPRPIDEREKERNKAAAAAARKKEKELKKKASSSAAKNSLGSVRDWEEATRLENKGRTGEWRRRRWVRLVKRIVVGSAGAGANTAAAGSSLPS
ncbi:uncharacterized protein A1O9_05806 [Exophiala aquamarina CBS 119918]|uniref:BZIP domain-containing protein n=1 Tax=Exophiala aquamarina CBS 119918 TaxID=1182545 RepID=A0A072PQV5_9EURO|nr:uncharacterized protein A1O9_05806 [Exophiala aquamarina CBS 119918]KEF57885.1 hypothetical protein A1O9_05806 [Exophiala aquamarina CBS 119918]